LQIITKKLFIENQITTQKSKLKTQFNSNGKNSFNFNHHNAFKMLNISLVSTLQQQQFNMKSIKFIHIEKQDKKKPIKTRKLMTKSPLFNRVG